MALKILVCDDERHIVRLIQVNLEKQGYQVVTAYDGKEGLEKIRAEKPNLVVLDVMMPYMDGFEVLKSLRKDPEFETLPVIMLTAKAPFARRTLVPRPARPRRRWPLSLPSRLPNTC